MNSTVIETMISVQTLVSPGFDGLMRTSLSLGPNEDYEIVLPSLSETIPAKVTIRREVAETG